MFFKYHRAWSQKSMTGHSILGRNMSEKDLGVTAGNHPEKPELQQWPGGWRNENCPWLHRWHGAAHLHGAAGCWVQAKGCSAEGGSEKSSANHYSSGSWPFFPCDPLPRTASPLPFLLLRLQFQWGKQSLIQKPLHYKAEKLVWDWKTINYFSLGNSKAHGSTACSKATVFTQGTEAW